MQNARSIRENASENKKLPWIWRLMPSLSDLAFAIPIILLFLPLHGVRTLLGDGDTGWHIRTGEWILDHHRIPAADLFSFTKPGQPWFAWEWAWDAAFALVHRYTGLSGVVALNILLLCFCSLLLFRLVRRVSGNDVLSLAVSTVAIVGSSYHWLARPHLISWIFLLLFAHAIQRACEGNTRWLWWLPLLTVLWTNLHGSFFVGIAMLVCWSVGVALHDLRVPDCPGAGRRRWVRLAISAFLCALASFGNPYGWELHHHVVSYLLDSKQLENISEYQSINFHNSIAIYFETLLLLGWMCVYWCVRQKRYAEALWLLLWSHLGLVSGRNIPIYLFAAAAPVASMIQSFVEVEWASSTMSLLRRMSAAFHTFTSEFGANERIPRWHVPSIGLAAVVCFLVLFGSGSEKLKADYNPKNYPAAALPILQEAGISNVFTDDEWGDYIIYRLYPHCRVFIDGRSDFYGADFGSRYLNLMNVRYDWERNLSRFPVDAVLLHTDSALTAVLKESHRWKAVFDDGTSIVFRPAGVTASQGLQSSSILPDGGRRSVTPTVRRSPVIGLGPTNNERRSSS